MADTWTDEELALYERAVTLLTSISKSNVVTNRCLALRASIDRRIERERAGITAAIEHLRQILGEYALFDGHSETARAFFNTLKSAVDPTPYEELTSDS